MDRISPRTFSGEERVKAFFFLNTPPSGGWFVLVAPVQRSVISPFLPVVVVVFRLKAPLPPPIFISGYVCNVRRP